MRATWWIWNGAFVVALAGLALATWRPQRPIARRVAWICAGASLCFAIYLLVTRLFYPLTWAPYVLFGVSTILKLRAHVPRGTPPDREMSHAA